MQRTSDKAGKEFALKHSFKPYVGLTVIFLAVGLFMTMVTIQTRDWGDLSLIWVMMAFFVGFFIVFGTRYRIWWHEGEVTQRAVGGQLTSIKVGAITEIKQETSDAVTALSVRRPFRRIAIYGEPGKWIDVSLKHFVAGDIRKLMNLIHQERSELQIPKNWI